MPKIVQDEKYYKKYTENDIQKALEEIKIGKPLRVVSRQYKIPRATLQFRKSQNYVKPTFGPNPILSSDEEKILVNWIFENHKRGVPRRKDDVQESVKEFLDQRPRENPFVNNCPGETWYRAFLRRNPEVTERTSEAVTAASANVSESNIKKWFAEIEDYLTSKGFREILDDPTRVMNADETCFHLCPKNNKVLAPRGARNVYEVEHAFSKATLTVMFTFTASGQVTPPMIVHISVRASRMGNRSFRYRLDENGRYE
ncbi:homeobox-like domain superfamily [Holotrichia oblita]|uniref:Homeobox-like domain superfamily n=1 Tax=Holotrichia oblita TaxID=644536 RepID=A0ACB9THK2_HOLOL|nr:homeobox-like domain superfamily [Holotrichia oblita]